MESVAVKKVLMNWGIRLAKEGKDPHAYTKDLDTGTLPQERCEEMKMKYVITKDWTKINKDLKKLWMLLKNRYC